jgi:hypothetical protein
MQLIGERQLNMLNAQEKSSKKNFTSPKDRTCDQPKLANVIMMLSLLAKWIGLDLNGLEKK